MIATPAVTQQQVLSLLIPPNLCPHSHLPTFYIPAISFLPLRLVHTALCLESIFHQYIPDPPPSHVSRSLSFLIHLESPAHGCFPDSLCLSRTDHSSEGFLSSFPAHTTIPQIATGASHTLLSLAVGTFFSPLEEDKSGAFFHL